MGFIVYYDKLERTGLQKMNSFVCEMLHGIAKKRWAKIKDNPEKDWKVEWEKFRWKRLAASDFEKRHLPDFRSKAEAARKRENAARHYSEFDFMLCWYVSWLFGLLFPFPEGEAESGFRNLHTSE